MKEFFNQMLNDGGKVSSMRFSFVIGVILAIVLTFITLFKEGSVEALTLFAGMYSVLGAGKILQKRQEIKRPL